MPTPEPFKETNINSLEEFESTYSSMLTERNLYQCVFRGQSEAIWGLVPSIFRNLNDDNISIEDIKMRIKEEFSGVANFVYQADKLGFDLPGDLWDFLNRKKFDINKMKEFRYWYFEIDNYWAEQTTIAQHYGIKTRYLDFTHNPYAAIYFAAEEATKKLLNEVNRIEGSNEHFSVWFIDELYLKDEGSTIKLHRAPTARNKYLNAQKGLFISYPLPSLRPTIETVPKKSLDIAEIAIEDCRKLGEKYPGFKRRLPAIYKFNFPFDVAPEILQKLNNNYDINLSTLKPNLENIISNNIFTQKVNNLAYHLRQRDKE